LSTKPEGVDNANSAVSIAGKAAIVENEQLKLELVNVKAERDTLTKALAIATETIVAEKRAKLIPEILSNTNLTKEEVSAMSLDTMFDLKQTFAIMKRSPSAASVRPGVDDGEQDARSTVPNKYKYGKDRKEA